MVTILHMWLLNTWDMANVTDELGFKFYLISLIYI